MELPGIVLSLAAVGGALFVLSQEELRNGISGQLGAAKEVIAPVGTMNSIGGPPPAVTMSLFGMRYRDGAVLNAGAAPLMAKDLFATPPGPGRVSPPGLTPLPVMSSCTIPPPRAGEVVRPVHVDNAPETTDVHLLSETGLARATLQELRHHKKTYGRRIGTSDFDADVTAASLRMVTVAVTETAAPVHLVLHSNGHLGWAVTIAPGVRLARVTVLGTGAVALSMPDPVIPVTVIDDMSGLCGMVPIRALHDDWEVMERWETVNDTQTPKSWKDDFARYDRWFRDRFGTGADEAPALSADETAFVLVGPPPAGESGRPPLPDLSHVPLPVAAAGAEAYVATQDENRAYVRKRGRALLEQALAGPLETLRPVAEERAAP